MVMEPRYPDESRMEDFTYMFTNCLEVRVGLACNPNANSRRLQVRSPACPRPIHGLRNLSFRPRGGGTYFSRKLIRFPPFVKKVILKVFFSFFFPKYSLRHPLIMIFRDLQH